MNIIRSIFVKHSAIVSSVAIAAFAVCMSVRAVSAASIPVLTLANAASSVNISVTGADPGETVMFYYPNGSVSNSTSPSYTSIDLGTTDSRGQFNVSVAPNSYGLSGGVSVYISIDGANSSTVVWPASANSSGQTGSLSLSGRNLNLTVGQSESIYPMNTSNALAVQGNSNPSVVSATIQTSNNTLFVNGLNAGSSVIAVCASTIGCTTVNATVTAPTQKVAFNQAEAYVMVGQPAQAVGIYGPGSYNGLTNTDKDAVSASISGTNLMLQGLVVGQSTVSVCADGYLCGSIVVHSLSSGSAVPTQTTILAPVSSGFNQPPQLSSLSVSSNDVSGLFFGIGSTISINFGTNETVTNVNVMLAGTQVTANQGANGLYYTSYKMTGDENLPLPVSISFVDLSGKPGHIYFWIGNSPTASFAATSALSPAIVDTSSSPYVFNNYLYDGMDMVGQSDRDVVALQNRLHKDGFFAGSSTGYFGPQTKAAVEAYQKKNGLSAIGVVGPATRTLLNSGI